MKVVIFLFFFLVSQQLYAQSDDEREVRLVVNRLYETLCFSDTNQIRVDSMQSLFIPSADFVTAFEGTPMTWSVSKYISVIKETIRTQQVSFTNERELYGKIEIFGNIAHVFSTYELKMVIKGKELVRRGINSIQFVRDNGKWLISSLVWDRESETLKIPSKYLGE